MERTRPVEVPPERHRPEELVMAFLESLRLCRKTPAESQRTQPVGKGIRHSWKLSTLHETERLYKCDPLKASGPDATNQRISH